MEVRGKLINVSRPYYQVGTDYTKQCVSFIISDKKGKKHFFSVSYDDHMKLIMISETGDELVVKFCYRAECGLLRAGHNLESVENLTLGVGSGLDKMKKQRISGRLVRLSKAFCLTTTFYHGGHGRVRHEVIVRVLFVLNVEGRKIIAETEKMEVIQFLQMADYGDALTVEFTCTGEVSYVRNKNLKVTYRDLHK
mgnify:CR=1 FL=1